MAWPYSYHCQSNKFKWISSSFIASKCNYKIPDIYFMLEGILRSNSEEIAMSFAKNLYAVHPKFSSGYFIKHLQYYLNNSTAYDC